MILFCRKNQPNSLFKNNNFVYLHEMPAMDDFRAEDMKKAPEKVEKAEVKDNPEATAKEREGLLARHKQVAERIQKAEEKYGKCMAITSKLPEGTDSRTTAENACKKARDTLDKINDRFPEKINLAADKKSGDSLESKDKPKSAVAIIQEFETVLSRINSKVKVVATELATTEEAANIAKESMEALGKLGIDDKTIQAIFKENPNNIKDIISFFNKIKDGGKDDNFKKIIEQVNKNGGINQLHESYQTLLPLKLSVPQMTEALSLNCVISGAVNTKDLADYLKIATTDKKIDVEFALSVVDKIDMKGDIGSQLEKSKFYEETTKTLQEQGLDTKIDAEKMQNFVDFIRDTKDLSIPLDGKVELFNLENNPKDAKELYHLAEIYAAHHLGEKVMDAARTIRGFDSSKGEEDIMKSLLTLKKGSASEAERSLDADNISDRMNDYKKELKKDYPELANDTKKVAIIMELYKSPDDASIGCGNIINGDKNDKRVINSSLLESRSGAALLFINTLKQMGFEPMEIVKKWESGNRDPEEIKELESYRDKYPSIAMNIETGRLLESNPGLYPFLKIVTDRAKADNYKNDEIKTFSHDPGLPNAIKINETFKGKTSGFLSDMDIANAEQYLKLGRALDLEKIGPTDPRLSDGELPLLGEGTTAPTKFLNIKFKMLKDHAEAKADTKLYTYIATIKDENGVEKQVEKKREVIAAFCNEMDVSTKQPKFYRSEILDGLANNGVDKNDKDPDEVKQEQDEDPTKPNYKPRTLFKTENDSPTTEQLSELKQKIINRMKNAQPPMTMVFNGHGGSDGKADGFDIDNEANKAKRASKVKPDPGTITAEDLVSIIKERNVKFKDNPLLSQDIYLFSACDSKRIVVNVLKQISNDQSSQALIPMMGGASDYGFSVGMAGHDANTLQTSTPNPSVKDIDGVNVANNNRSTFMFAANGNNQPQPVVDTRKIPPTIVAKRTTTAPMKTG